MAVQGATPGRRRRRTPEEARAEIMQAARGVLEDRGAGGLTVAEVMQRTTLTRKSFYVHFGGRAELLLALLQPLRAGADATLRAWSEAPADPHLGRAALLEAARAYREHGAALRAVFWDGGEDEEIMAVRRQLTDPIVRAARAAVRAASVEVRDPDALARALATMNVHVLLAEAPACDDTELEALTDTLAAIWLAALA